MGIVRGMNANTLHMRLSDLPLWRLLVALDDAERTAGPDSPTARILARAIQLRMRGEHLPSVGKEAPHAKR
jgi:hypothetical protein